MARQTFLSFLKPLLGIMCLGMGIVSCETTESPTQTRGPVIEVPREQQTQRSGQNRTQQREASRYDPRGYVDPLHMRDAEPVRVGLLLPFSASSESVKRVSSAMFDAAQLAAFEAADSRFLIIPKDTKGTPEGAAAAARSALADGAEILLGPLFSDSVDAVASVARAARTPVIAFSSLSLIHI